MIHYIDKIVNRKGTCGYLYLDKKRPTKCSAQALGPKEGVVPPCTEHLIDLDYLHHLNTD